MTDLPSPNPAAAQAANPATPDPAQAAGTVQPSGQVGGGQSAPAEDSFTKLDVNTLPPQLKQAYDNMLRDYKSKTAELSEQRKKYEGYDTYKQRAELYEQLASQEEFVKRWNEYVKEVNGQTATNPNDPVQAKLQEFEKQLQEERRAREEREMDDVVEGFRSAKDEKGNPVNPDFDALADAVIGKDQEGGDWNLLRAYVHLAEGNTPQEKLANGYKAAKALRDQWVEEGRKQGVGKMLSKVRNSTEAPAITSDKQTFNGDAKKLSVREARELAEKGVVVH